mmetsp:Transcript_144321/g.269026  ORF Transcript_144321/g.269026 Transcript_144321/m.269026 type:complete len:366 (+) Transcript_144321:1614-2711(+)
MPASAPFTAIYLSSTFSPSITEIAIAQYHRKPSWHFLSWSQDIAKRNIKSKGSCNIISTLFQALIIWSCTGAKIPASSSGKGIVNETPPTSSAFSVHSKISPSEMEVFKTSWTSPVTVSTVSLANFSKLKKACSAPVTTTVLISSAFAAAFAPNSLTFSMSFSASSSSLARVCIIASSCTTASFSTITSSCDFSPACSCSYARAAAAAASSSAIFAFLASSSASSRRFSMRCSSFATCSLMSSRCFVSSLTSAFTSAAGRGSLGLLPPLKKLKAATATITEKTMRRATPIVFRIRPSRALGKAVCPTFESSNATGSLAECATLLTALTAGATASNKTASTLKCRCHEPAIAVQVSSCTLQHLRCR